MLKKNTLIISLKQIINGTEVGEMAKVGEKWNNNQNNSK